MKDSGVTVTEELKLITDEEWNQLIRNLNLKIIQSRRLKNAIELLKSTGAYDPLIGSPIPINRTHQLRALH